MITVERVQELFNESDTDSIELFYEGKNYLFSTLRWLKARGWYMENAAGWLPLSKLEEPPKVQTLYDILKLKPSETMGRYELENLVEPYKNQLQKITINDRELKKLETKKLKKYAKEVGAMIYCE